MFTRILTQHERETIHRFLQGHCGRDSTVRQIVSRTRKHLKTILDDAELAKALVEAYEHVEQGELGAPRPKRTSLAKTRKIS